MTTPPLTRVGYRDGQVLTADDLNDDCERESSLRALHAKYLHDTWGIAQGFDVAVTSGGGGLRVKPGYAVDRLGRDLRLTRTIVTAAPRTSAQESRVLVARLPVRHDRLCGATHSHIARCTVGPRAVDVAAPTTPELVWEKPNDVRLGQTVPLATVVVRNAKVLGPPDLRCRRYARPLVPRRLFRGATAPGSTGWRVWSEPGYGALGLEAPVDTSAAGIVHEPVYLAALTHATQTLDESVGWIVSASAETFLYRVPRVDLWTPMPADPAEAEKHKWTVSWIALERSHA